MNFEFLGGKVVVATGVITEQTTDAIVNAANSTLLGGGVSFSETRSRARRLGGDQEFSRK